MILANSKKIVGAGVLAVSLIALPATLPAAAQTSSPAPTNQVQNDSNRPALDTTPFQETKDDFNNLGWLGALGLIGLANLFRKPKRRTTTYTGTTVGTTTGTTTGTTIDPTVTDQTDYRP